MGKKRFLKTFTSTALACVLTASSLIGVFAAEGTRTISRSTVEWAKDISYNYPKGTQTVQYSEGLQFAMHYFKSNDESGDLISPIILRFVLNLKKVLKFTARVTLSQKTQQLMTAISIDGLDMLSGNSLVKYTVTELGVKAEDGSYSIPERYIPDKLTQTVTLSQDKAVTVKFVNHLKNGSISIVKKTSDGKLLDGVKLRLLNKSTNQQVGEIQTTKNGSAKFTNVPIGNYYVEEIATAAGYSLLKEKVIESEVT